MFMLEAIDQHVQLRRFANHPARDRLQSERFLILRYANQATNRFHQPTGTMCLVFPQELHV